MFETAIWRSSRDPNKNDWHDFAFYKVLSQYLFFAHQTLIDAKYHVLNVEEGFVYDEMDIGVETYWELDDDDDHADGGADFWWVSFC